MKKNIAIFIFLFVTGNISIAQKPDWATDVYMVDEMYPGYIIKTNGEKIEGYLKALPRGPQEGGELWPSNQTRCDFFSDPKNKKTKVVYKPADLQGYKIADKYYKSIPYSGGLTSKVSNFCLQTSTGRISSYVWYNFVEANKKWEEKTLIQKGDEKPIDQSMLMLGFAKKMSEMVGDYAELAAKVANKEKGYGVGSIDAVIKEYNEWYAKNHPQN
jgi:hypothetical protein